MTERMTELVDKIIQLQAELDREIEARRRGMGWTLKDRMIEFEEGLALQHRKMRIGVRRYLRQSELLTVVTAPVIYSLIIPMALADAWVSLYQAICFRAYGIARVERSQYFAFDRHRLGYLNIIQSINCLFCAYANGVVSYVREISSRTEQYWCPIKHALKTVDPHDRYQAFLEYGDAGGFRDRLNAFRDGLRAEALAKDG
jgi:hypothetical protein